MLWVRLYLLWCDNIGKKLTLASVACVLQRSDDRGAVLILDEANASPQYQTAIAVLILSVPANYLPIYQR